MFHNSRGVLLLFRACLRTQVHLLPETQQLLKSFYAPYVLELQHMFNDAY